MSCSGEESVRVDVGGVVGGAAGVDVSGDVDGSVGGRYVDNETRRIRMKDQHQFGYSC